jgi:hypothetical protein
VRVVRVLVASRDRTLPPATKSGEVEVALPEAGTRAEAREPMERRPAWGN